MVIRSGLALCAGIGGIELGLKLACPTYRTVCYVEREAFCAAHLVQRMEEGRLDPAPIWSDLRTFNASKWRGRVDLVTGGYPCQPFSVAGKRRGEQDPRHLWPEFVRIIGECQPQIVFCENVQGHLSKGFAGVLSTLDALGFDAEWGVFTAAASGAPHRRARLFVLAHRRGNVAYAGRGAAGRDELRRLTRQGRPRASNADTHGQDVAHGFSQVPIGTVADAPRVGQQRAGPLQDPAGRGQLNDTDEELGDSDRPRPQRRVRHGNASERPPWPPGPTQYGQWAGVQADLKPAICRVANGIPHRVDRLRALGNAVVPAVAARAFTELMGRI